MFLPNEKEIQQIDLAVRIGKNGYFLDMSGKYIYEYHLETFALQKYAIHCSHDADGNYAFVIPVENQIYIFTRAMEKLVIFNTVTKKVDEKLYPAYMENLRLVCGCCDSERIWLFPQKGEMLFSYSIASGEWCEFDLNADCGEVLSVACGNKCLYLLTKTGKVFEYHVDSAQIRMLFSLGIESSQQMPSRILCLKNKLLILPGTNDDFFSFDLKQSDLLTLDAWPKEAIFDRAREKWFKFYGYCEDETYYYFANRVSDYYLKIDKCSAELIWIKVSVPSGMELMKCLLPHASGTLQEKECSLPDYISSIANDVVDCNRNGGEAIIGKKIWRSLMEWL